MPEYHERHEVFVAVSRNGFPNSRPPAPRLPIAALDESNWTDWNWYVVQSAAGNLTVHEDTLHMYSDEVPACPPNSKRNLHGLAGKACDSSRGLALPRHLVARAVAAECHRVGESEGLDW